MFSQNNGNEEWKQADFENKLHLLVALKTSVVLPVLR
jgi:hypothetical protein